MFASKAKHLLQLTKNEDEGQFTVRKKIAAVHFATICCEPN